MDLGAMAWGMTGGALVGAVSGFMCALVMLTARRLENRRLTRRGEPPKKHLVLPKFHIPGTVLGSIAGGAATFFTSVVWSIVIAAAAPVVGLTLALFVALLMARR